MLFMTLRILFVSFGGTYLVWECLVGRFSLLALEVFRQERDYCGGFNWWFLAVMITGCLYLL